MKTLVIFTMQFPYGQGEAFIESEFPFLCRAFDKIIVVTNNIHTSYVRPVPPNVEVVRREYTGSLKHKIKAGLFVFSEIFSSEIQFVRNKLNLKLNRGIFFTLFGAVSNGYKTKDSVEAIMRQHDLKPSETWLYSYWLYDVAVGQAMIKQKYPEVKSFCRVHRWDLYFYANPSNYLPLRPFLLKFMDRCYAISEDGKQYLERLIGGENASKVVVSRLGVRNEHSIRAFGQSETITIVSCSSISTPKRVNLIIDALARLSGIKIKWLHYGTGDLKEEVENYAGKTLAGMTNVSYTFMGLCDNSDVLKFYSENAIDLFINLSSSEGIPVSIMEAMSFGIPVIATAAGGMQEIVKDGYNGFLLNVSDTPDMIAKAITKYIELTEDKKKKIKDNAHSTWKEQYNASKNYEEFVRSILAL